MLMAKQEFSKILVPVDGSECSMRAADLAIGVAKKYGAKMIAINVLNINQYLQTIGFYGVSYSNQIEKMIGDAKQEASEWFAEIQKKAEQEGVQIQTDVIDTPLSVVGGIVNYAERENADLIVIGTRGRSGFTKLLLGSVASGVVSYAPCPVMVAR